MCQYLYVTLYIYLYHHTWYTIPIIISSSCCMYFWITVYSSLPIYAFLFDRAPNFHITLNLLHFLFNLLDVVAILCEASPLVKYCVCCYTMSPNMFWANTQIPCSLYHYFYIDSLHSLLTYLCFLVSFFVSCSLNRITPIVP